MSRKAARLLLSVIALFVIASVCTGIYFFVRDNSPEKQIVGTWRQNDSWFFSFGENGRWSISDLGKDGKYTAVYGGRYTISAQTLTMYTDGYVQDDIFIKSDISFDGDDMVWIMLNVTDSKDTFCRIIRYGDDEMRLFVGDSYIFNRKE